MGRSLRLASAPKVANEPKAEDPAAHDPSDQQLPRPAHMLYTSQN